jgi:putative endonuclease
LIEINKKKLSYYFGLIAEKIAAWYLRICLYQIIAHRYKTKLGEIDLIARKKNTLIFFEIKARKDTALMEFITIRQKNRINRAAQHFLLYNPKYQKFNIRFDAIIIDKFFLIKHFKNYWQE